MSNLNHHQCQAIGCTRTIPKSLLMCGRHWASVPQVVQNKIWRHYSPGQEYAFGGIGGPSEAYMQAYQEAVEAVATLEGRSLTTPNEAKNPPQKENG